MTQANTYNPEDYLVSTVRALKEYTDNGFNAAYEIIMEFPSTDKIVKMVPGEKTLVHFELDIQDDRKLGFGKNIGGFNFDIVTGNVKPQEAGIHVLNFDVGIWSWDKSGGTTSRMRAKQFLFELFGGALAQQNLDNAVDVGDGRIEILEFTGGRFVTDQINDVNVYRMVDCNLNVRVFSRVPRTSVVTAGPAITSILQDENLDIGGVPIP